MLVKEELMENLQRQITMAGNNKNKKIKHFNKYKKL